MRIAAALHQGQRVLGCVDDAAESIHLFDVDASRGAQALVEAAAAGRPLPAPTGARLPLSAMTLTAPLPFPRRNVWCVGRNYHAHAAELRDSVFKGDARPVDAWPIVFTKVPETVCGPHDAVELPGEAVSAQIDYEAELALVIGRGGRDIRREDAMAHVFGWTLVNDVTARDVQMRHAQWELGKSLDGFCPMGPWIATADSLDGRDLRIRCWVNDELRQDARTSQLIFDVPTLIETCSRGITLQPGDVIATGTPAGVGMGLQPPRWLQPGDVVRIELEGLGGGLLNRFVARGGAR